MPYHEHSIEYKQVPGELRPGQVFESAIECHQDAVPFNRHSQQIGICHLLVAGDARRERRGESGPTLFERPITISGPTRELLQNAGCFFA